MGNSVTRLGEGREEEGGERGGGWGGGGAGKEKHLKTLTDVNTSSNPLLPPPPQPDGIEKGLSVRREQGRVGGGGVKEGEARSRKFSAIPEIKKNAGAQWTQEAPLPFSLSPVCT